MPKGTETAASQEIARPRVGVVIPSRTPTLALASVESLSEQVRRDDIVVVATSHDAEQALSAVENARVVTDVPFRGYGAAARRSGGMDASCFRWDRVPEVAKWIQPEYAGVRWFRAELPIERCRSNVMTEQPREPHLFFLTPPADRPCGGVLMIHRAAGLARELGYDATVVECGRSGPNRWLGDEWHVVRARYVTAASRESRFVVPEIWASRILARQCALPGCDLQ